VDATPSAASHSTLANDSSSVVFHAGSVRGSPAYQDVHRELSAASHVTLAQDSATNADVAVALVNLTPVPRDVDTN